MQRVVLGVNLAARRYCEKIGGAVVSKLLDDYARQSATPLTIQQLLHAGLGLTPASIWATSRFVHNEFKIRLAHMIREIDAFPGALKHMPSVVTVRSFCMQSFKDLVTFPEFREDGTCAAGQPDPVLKRLEFANLIDDVMDRHASVMVTLAQGVRELKRKMAERAPDGTDPAVLDAAFTPPVQEFLDRFHTCRIGIRALGRHYTRIFGHRDIEPLENRQVVGIVDRRCDLAAVAQEAAIDARDICERAYGRAAPEVQIELPRGEAVAAYVPSHLHFVLFELLKNALRATVEHQDRLHGPSTNRPLPPVRITLVRGSEEDVSIRISDHGGGIPRRSLPLLYTYTFTTVPEQPAMADGQHGAGTDGAVPLAGFGYGLPLSRLYARYFGGESMLVSMEGLGTDAFVFLRASPDKAQEVLPVSADRRELARWYQYMKSEPRLRCWTSSP